ncbi:uracil phosphoribosyltransferase-domain-containing protein [Colletotrichum godetiae]|uniref:Uracil phosphoribosyltransferase-domain-containing protein n=1 Tax=Colletotrichum godetiae TaxID=1209918 RepID=A0AAJ0AGG5_9PEZI|nr:uracil phosphoribosyltransferase-domain-containing protein [Colletotrichum godetiae]KAK1673459.1 uracil phosphoribosyltransferase-domain-containing protein [Colletotrichum godetiae]
MAAEKSSDPIIVGLYGLPGSGKSYLLRHLKTYFGVGNRFQYYEGSEVIGNLVGGGLEAFKRLDKDTQNLQRKRAIQLIADECITITTGRIGIVTGHYSFWNDKNSPREIVWTMSDMRVYTHILYLDMSANRLCRRRPDLQPGHLSKWRNAEMAGLSRLSRLNGIQHMLRNLVTQDEENLGRVIKETDLLLFSNRDGDLLDTGLVLDADRTLCAVDTGTMFWERLKATSKRHDQDRIWDVPEIFEDHWLCDDPVCPLKRLFSEKNYSFASFNQAMSLHEYVDGAFDEVCKEVASAVSLYPEFMALIHALERHRGCGLRQIWKLILEREGLDDSVEIIGGGRFADCYVIIPEAKAVVVSQFQAQGVSVWAFGDSPMDLPMLKMADQAIVVVGEKRLRSKTMDAELVRAITDDKDFLPRQALIQNHSTPRLTPDQLPIVEISGQAFMESFFYRYANLRVLHATKKSASKLLMTPTRDASVAGPSLRAAHGHVGRYLATEFLTELLGLEYFPIPHVQGYKTDGHRLVDESRTAIVTLMRGDEPMAFGVSEAFPSAIFIHAKNATEITKKTLGGMKTLLLEFVDHIRGLELGIRIVVVACVVQAKAISHVLEPLACEGDLSLVALRLSDNKFTGSGGTDTGNRLFNTVHLD